MVVKVYISGISGNKEVKKRQQRVLLILDSKNVKYEILDIAEPNMEEAKEYMQNNSKLMGGTIGDPNPRHPLPPQIFNEEEYCGDYDAFDMANELDEMEKFLKLCPGDDTVITSNAEVKLGNGEVLQDTTKEASPENDIPTNNTDDAKLKVNEENIVPITEKTEEFEEELEDKKENESDDQKIKNGSREVEDVVEDTEIETEKSDEA